ncbi:sigma-54-dependent transcriptional regulator [Thermodesulfobacteriota bacterium]
MRSALVVSEDNDVLKKIRAGFPPGYRVENAPDKSSALEIFKKKRCDIVFIDLKLLLQSMQEKDYTTDLQSFKLLYPSTEIVVMSYPDRIREAVKVVRAGASDYLTYPIDPEEAKFVVETIRESIIKQSELDHLRDEAGISDAPEIATTTSPVMIDVLNKIRSVALTKTTVLLIGETGTGKSVLAKLIHQYSNRKNSQFISVHCGAIPDTLLESELFGHEKGAFTGAVRKKLGKFEIAIGGTIFLDEIGTITPMAQINLLQVLQDGTFSRVGGEETIETNARVVAATNADLKQMMADGWFRKDLYYRLNVFPVEIPPLRERAEEIPFLIDVFLNRLKQDFQKDIKNVHPFVLDALKKYTWPGNIRELENLMERAYILENSSMLTPESFPSELFETQDSTAILPMNSTIHLADARRRAIENFERQYLKELLSRNKGKIKASAHEAGISTRQLHKMMSKYGIRKEDFRAALDQ